MIVDKLYESGRLDDAQKKEAMASIKNVTVQLQRNSFNKIIVNFINQWNISFNLNASLLFR